MRLIAISGKRRTGKTLLAHILKERYQYQPISLAEPLKQMVRHDFNLHEEQTDGCLKEQPTHLVNGEPGKYFTPREIMIRVGQFYRSIDKDFWTRKLFDQIKETPQAQMHTFVIPDVRFMNELDWMKRHKALLVRLERDEAFTGKNIDDLSETELDNCTDWDLILDADKNCTKDDLETFSEKIHDRIMAQV